MSTLSQQVVAGLKDKILAGDLPAGAKLPSEAELLEQYAVSRTVVREAVTRLRAEGIVETQQGRGSFVLAVPEPSSFTVESSAIRSHRDVLAMVDFRLGIESEAAALAAAHRDHDDEARSARRWRLSLTSGRRERWRPTSPSTWRSRGATHNRFYVDLLDSLGPMMILLPRTRLGSDLLDDRRNARRACAARARKHCCRRPGWRCRYGPRGDARPPRQHPAPDWCRPALTHQALVRGSKVGSMLRM